MVKRDLLYFRDHNGQSRPRTMAEIEHISAIRNIGNSHWVAFKMKPGEASVSVADGFRNEIKKKDRERMTNAWRFLCNTDDDKVIDSIGVGLRFWFWFRFRFRLAYRLSNRYGYERVQTQVPALIGYFTNGSAGLVL